MQQPQQQPQQTVQPQGFAAGPVEYVPGESKTLWMGAIQPHWDETFVASLFPQPNGEVVNVKVMRHPTSNLPLGYAFIDFPTHEAAQNALNTLNGQQVPGTSVVFRLNWGAGGRRPFGSVQEFSLFVGDLGPEVSDAMLQEAFASRYPSCSSAKVVTDAASGISKGYGFARFTDKAQCDDALQVMSGIIVGSRPIRVSPATARRQDRHMLGSPHHGSQTQFHAYLPNGMMNSGYRPTSVSNVSPVIGQATLGGSSPWMNARTAPAPQSPEMLQHQQLLASSVAVAGTTDPTVGPESGAPASEPSSTPSTLSSPQHSENTTVFVGNLDPSVTEDQLHNHFQGFGNIIQVKIPPNRGCGFVKYDNRESAEKALATLHGSTLAGLRIRLDWGKANASGRRHSGLAMGMDPSMGGYTTMQAQQYYYAQWQAQQQAQAYYYRYGAQAPMYVMPQQAMQQQGYAGRQQGYVANGIQYTQAPMIAGTMLPDETGAVDYGTQAQPLMNQQATAGLAWNEAVQ